MLFFKILKSSIEKQFSYLNWMILSSWNERFLSYKEVISSLQYVLTNMVVDKPYILYLKSVFKLYQDDLKGYIMALWKWNINYGSQNGILSNSNLDNLQLSKHYYNLKYLYSQIRVCFLNYYCQYFQFQLPLLKEVFYIKNIEQYYIRNTTYLNMYIVIVCNSHG